MAAISQSSSRKQNGASAEKLSLTDEASTLRIKPPFEFNKRRLK